MLRFERKDVLNNDEMLTRKNDISVCSNLMNLFSCFHRLGGGADEGFGIFAVEVEEEF